MQRLRSVVAEREPLPLFAGVASLPLVRTRRNAVRFLNYALLNQDIETIFRRLPNLTVQAWLTSGCLVQTVWNLKRGRPPRAGIDDYDLIYFDPDTSWEKEDSVIREVAALFHDLPIKLQIRNQARVPLWYREKFKIDYPPVSRAYHSLRRYPSRTTAIAVTLTRTGEWLWYAPFGLSDALNMRVRPNPRLPLAAVYSEKSARWLNEWPDLVVEPWHPSEERSEPCSGKRASTSRST